MDNDTSIDDVNSWIPVRIKTVEQRVNIMAVRHMMDRCLVSLVARSTQTLSHFLRR
jgi:hypothetical protein